MFAPVAVGPFRRNMLDKDCAIEAKDRKEVLENYSRIQGNGNSPSPELEDQKFCSSAVLLNYSGER